MTRRHLPTRWLMTDERMGEALRTALIHLPRGAGVVFRHYHTPPAERRRLFAMVLRIARRRGLVVVRAGGRVLRAEDGAHNQPRRHRGLRTMSAHNRPDIARAERTGADLVFVSPVFATRSHPDARGMGPVRLGLMIRDTRVPIVALGGMDAARFRRLRGLGLYGWAGIDAWIRPDAAKPRRQSWLRHAGRAQVRDAD
jgi:thiamine-phosphate pyrophosphorylase